MARDKPGHKSGSKIIQDLELWANGLTEIERKTEKNFRKRIILWEKILLEKQCLERKVAGQYTQGYRFGE